MTDLGSSSVRRARPCQPQCITVTAKCKIDSNKADEHIKEKIGDLAHTSFSIGQQDDVSRWNLLVCVGIIDFGIKLSESFIEEVFENSTRRGTL
jgi:hypothetical protein